MKCLAYILLAILFNCSGSESKSDATTEAPVTKDSVTETAEQYNKRKRAEVLGRNSASNTIKRETPASDKRLGQWYEGGTLHRARIHEWKRASEENKLATCADFAAKINKSVSMEVLLGRAVELRACINEATRDLDSVNDEKVADIAALCVTTLGY